MLHRTAIRIMKKRTEILLNVDILMSLIHDLTFLKLTDVFVYVRVGLCVQIPNFCDLCTVYSLNKSNIDLKFGTPTFFYVIYRTV